MNDISHKKEHPKPIPIGNQEYAYQMESVFFDYTQMHKKFLIDAFEPNRGGLLAYPNDEKELIEKYEFEFGHSYNGIEITLKKKYKDGRIGFVTTFVSFSQFINRLFEGHPASSWIREAPKEVFKSKK